MAAVNATTKAFDVAKTEFDAAQARLTAAATAAGVATPAPAPVIKCDLCMNTDLQLLVVCATCRVHAVCTEGASTVSSCWNAYISAMGGSLLTPAGGVTVFTCGACTRVAKYTKDSVARNVLNRELTRFNLADSMLSVTPWFFTLSQATADTEK